MRRNTNQGGHIMNDIFSQEVINEGHPHAEHELRVKISKSEQKLRKRKKKGKKVKKLKSEIKYLKKALKKCKKKSKQSRNMESYQFQPQPKPQIPPILAGIGRYLPTILGDIARDKLSPRRVSPVRYCQPRLPLYEGDVVDSTAIVKDVKRVHLS